MVMAKGKRPGVQLYFEIKPTLKRLTNEQKGMLLDAILDYGEFGILPTFDDDLALAITWDFIRPRIDADGERYRQSCEQKRKAANTRWGKSDNAPASECIQVDAPASERIQNDAPDANININPTSASISPPTSFSPPALEGSPSEGSDTALFGLLDDGPGFDTLRSEAINLLRGYK